MRVSLVMPTLDAGALLDDVVAGIDRQPEARALERVAVDSGSTDGTVDRLHAAGFTVHGIDRREFDHGATRDFAIAKTTGDVIVLLTQDAVPADERWLATLLEAYGDPRVGAAYCRQIPRPDCNPLLGKRIREWTASRPSKVVQVLEGEPQAAFDALAPMERLRVSAYDNVAGSVRRATWEQFHFGRRDFGEDVAFGKRVVLAGQAIVYEPRSAVVHSHNRSPKEEGKRIFCDHANLRELFGVHLLPALADCRRAIRSGREEFARLVEELPLTEAERAPLREWAAGYAFWSAVGMYLGGNAHRLRKGPLGPLFRLVERHLRRGI